MAQQMELVAKWNKMLLSNGLNKIEKTGFTRLDPQNPNLIIQQTFASIHGIEEDSPLSVSVNGEPGSADSIVQLLHQKGIKCVSFVVDDVILKAAKVAGQSKLDDYTFLNGHLDKNVMRPSTAHERASNLTAPEDDFLVHQRGLYVYGDDPLALYKRVLALHLAYRM